MPAAEHCCVPLCNGDKRRHPELSFHHIPKDKRRRKEWIHKIRRDVGRYFKTTRKTVVCSRHFVPSDYKWTAGSNRQYLKPGVIPTIFPWPEPTIKHRLNPKDKFVQDPKYSISDVGDDEDTTEAMETDPVPEEPVPDLTTEPQPGTSTSEAADAQLSYKIEQLQAQLANMTTELDNIKADNKTLQQNLQMERFGLQRFGSSDSDIKFFTGFPNYNVLMSFIRYIRSSALTMQSCYYVPSETLTCAGRPRSMLVEDELFMFLCRIRLGLMEQDLGIRFNCSQQTVSRKLITWANFLYFVLGSWPFWLDKSTVMQRLPPTFKESYPQTRVIIDCTEIRVQSPSSLVLNSQTYSSYKGTNTFKCLIGIAPHGAVTFVSLLFTGCMSDVEITKLSGILDLLEAEDSVMADKGFTLAKVLAEKEVTLNIPPFLGASGQFPAAQVLETQSIAKVRIHVERAIERIKRNHIFSSPLPWSLAGTANQLWTVACLLTNVQGPLINI